MVCKHTYELDVEKRSLKMADFPSEKTYLKGVGMETITKCLAANIRTLRKKKKMTQTELAKRAGISLIFLQGIESERKWVSPATTKAIAKALKVPESDLFVNCGPRVPKKQKLKRPLKPQLDHVPDDIFQALLTTCKTRKWKWDAIRWIIQGYEQNLK